MLGICIFSLFCLLFLLFFLLAFCPKFRKWMQGPNVVKYQYSSEFVDGNWKCWSPDIWFDTIEEATANMGESVKYVMPPVKRARLLKRAIMDDGTERRF